MGGRPPAARPSGRRRPRASLPTGSLGTYPYERYCEFPVAGVVPTMSTRETGEIVSTCIPARLDRLPWSRWHWLVVAALGITWILDGLEVTIVGAVGGVLTERQTLGLSSAQIGLAGSIYIVGAVAGALCFGYLTDRFGRKRLFMITLGLYVGATVATAFAWTFWSFALFRFLTGGGIGGEYSAINSAIDELIPSRVRGWVDIAINGSWWLGTIIGASLTLVLLDPHLLPHALGWRFAFGAGAVLGLVILVIRRYIPETPRWLMTHGCLEEAERVVAAIEDEVRTATGRRDLPPPDGPPMRLRRTHHLGFGLIARVMFRQYVSRSILGLSLMAGQAFLYNAIFFTYALVLTTFYHVPSGTVGSYLIPFAIGNVLGPWLLGRFFDTVGRRTMIALTYGVSGVLIIATGYLFERGVLTAVTQTAAWSVVFFFASAGASAAYLTVSEVFPLELRAMAIAFFYAVGTAIGGISGPVLFGALIQTGSAHSLFYGYLVGGCAMTGAAIVELFIGVHAERQPLEAVAQPLSVVAEEIADTA
jgi:MFS family permease